jgi:hypothetical protein
VDGAAGDAVGTAVDAAVDGVAPLAPQPVATNAATSTTLAAAVDRPAIQDLPLDLCIPASCREPPAPTVSAITERVARPRQAGGMHTRAGAVGWLADTEAVLALTVGGETRACPLQVMTWHEIVNDTVGGVPVAVTYCPLCNSGVAFERAVAGRVLSFGTSGLLFADNLVLWVWFLPAR